MIVDGAVRFLLFSHPHNVPPVAHRDPRRDVRVPQVSILRPGKTSPRRNHGFDLFLSRILHLLRNLPSQALSWTPNSAGGTPIERPTSLGLLNHDLAVSAPRVADLKQAMPLTITSAIPIGIGAALAGAFAYASRWPASQLFGRTLIAPCAPWRTRAHLR